jgi:hypothetical protein
MCAKPTICCKIGSTSIKVVNERKIENIHTIQALRKDLKANFKLRDKGGFHG